MSPNLTKQASSAPASHRRAQWRKRCGCASFSALVKQFGALCVLGLAGKSFPYSASAQLLLSWRAFENSHPHALTYANPPDRRLRTFHGEPRLTVLSTSLPAIAADLQVEPISLKLALTSYLLSLAVFVPISGWVADKYGARTVFMAAIAVFTGGSAALQPRTDLPEFVLYRIVQGLGGAMMVPVGRLVILRSVAKSEMISALRGSPSRR